MEIVNLTPHIINVFHGGEIVLSLPPAVERAPRLHLSETEAGSIQHGDLYIPVLVGRAPVGCDPIPDEEEGVLLVVPRAIAEYHAERRDLVWPDQLVRDVRGAVVGCRAFGARFV